MNPNHGRTRRRTPAIGRTARAAALTAATLAASTPTAAQQPDTATAPDTITLGELVVTATRVPLHRDALPTPVTVLTGAELRADGVATVAEALRRVPGAAVVRAGAPGAQTSLFLRGGESDYVKVLIDGVPVNDPGGAFDFAVLGTDQVERIEVVRGPASVLYGSDAVSGVIQVFTRRRTGEPRLTVASMAGRGETRYEEGGYGVAEGSATLTGGVGAFSYTAGGSRSWSGGLYPFNSDLDATAGTARIAWSPAGPAELAVTTRLSDSRAGFPTDGAGALVDRNARIDRRLWTTAVRAGLRLTDRLDAQLHLGLSTRRRATLDPVDGPADTVGTFASDQRWDVDRRSADLRANLALPATVLTAGVAWEDAVAETRYASESQWGPTQAEARYDRASVGYYLQLLSQPVEPLHVTAGARVDDHDVFGTFETYRVGAALRVLPGTRVRAAIGRAFREPSFDESFGSGFGDVGNPELRPERSRSWEVGLEHEPLPGVRLGATWFDQRFDDLIQFTFAPPSPDDANYFNVGAARSRGLEIEGRAGAARVEGAASYTYLRTEVLDPGLATDAAFVQGQRLLRRPTHAATLTGRYDLRDGRVSVVVHAVGERDDLDFSAGYPAPRSTLSAHATVDVAAEHALPIPGAPRTVVRLQVENLLDRDYQSVAGFPAPGRVARVGFRLSL